MFDRKGSICTSAFLHSSVSLVQVGQWARNYLLGRRPKSQLRCYKFYFKFKHPFDFRRSSYSRRSVDNNSKYILNHESFVSDSLFIYSYSIAYVILYWWYNIMYYPLKYWSRNIFSFNNKLLFATLQWGKESKILNNWRGDPYHARVKLPIFLPYYLKKYLR